VRSDCQVGAAGEGALAMEPWCPAVGVSQTHFG